LIPAEYDRLPVFVIACFALVPDYFWTIAASSTGKYHPGYALGEGGLVRHTKAAVGLAHDMLSLEFYQTKFSEIERDIIIAALILHDTVKHGKGEAYTVFGHPLLAAELIRKCNAEAEMLTPKQETLLCSAIASHMGQWTTSKYAPGVTLPKPKTEMQKFVHLCDYLASHRYLEYQFDV
jgi:hypothetical protein